MEEEFYVLIVPSFPSIVQSGKSSFSKSILSNKSAALQKRNRNFEIAAAVKVSRAEISDKLKPPFQHPKSVRIKQGFPIKINCLQL
jgi:hypothetical protein